ncbi:MAG: response regulator, partial [Gemmataceae bacterium]
HSTMEEAPRGSETILLVEDDEIVRRFTRDALTSSGYTVLEASNGGMAVRLAEEYSGAIHLLLSDVVMPEMGGRILAEKISATRPDTRVLFMSGYTDDAIVRHGILESDLAFLQKPFKIANLFQKIREVLDK